jgi:hypothetical protein
MQKIILDSNKRRNVSDSNIGVRNREKKTINLEPNISMGVEACRFILRKTRLDFKVKGFKCIF